MQPDHTATAWNQQDGYVEVNGVRLHYVEQGEGPLILFLHGFPEFWYGWKELLPEFAKDYHAVAVDMRGYNLSTMPEGVDAYQIPVLVEDIRALAEMMGVKRFVLAGHDWGGVIAWHFASAHSEMLEKLVIINAPHPTVFARELAHNPEQRKASGYFNLFCTAAAETVLSQDEYAVLQQVVFGGAWASDIDRKKYLDCWRRGLTGGLNYYRAADLKSTLSGEKPDARQSLLPGSPIAVPTLVIWGEKDIALSTGNLEGLDEHVENLKIQRVPQAGHFVVHEQPALVIQTMRRFLQHA